MAVPASGPGIAERRLAAAAPQRASGFDHATFAMLLDFDGTLVELKPTPQEVRVPASLKHTLSRLRDHLGGALSLVSGRPIADLDGFFAPLRLPIIGGHGAEQRLSAYGPLERSTVPPLDPSLRHGLIEIAARSDGILVENKEYSVALHYRLVPEMEQVIHAEILRLCAGWPAESIEILPGKAVFEIKPRAFNKGTAVEALMQRAPFAGRRPVFLGDDVTDETVFSILPKFDGLGFSVGRELAGTHGLFATPREVRHWLYELMMAATRR